MHIEPEQLDIQKNEILVEIEGTYYPVKSISVDQNGLFATFEGAKSARCPDCGEMYNVRYQ